MTTLSYTGKLTVVTCWCGMHHAVPEELHNHQLAAHRNGKEQVIYCPLGHSYVPSGESEVDRLQRQLQAERDRAARFASQRDQAEASARAHKGAATKARKRAAAALCPCCNRSFVQLRRHMETQHPDYDAAKA